MTTPSTPTAAAQLLDIPLVLLRESPLNYREQVDPTREAELEASLAAQGQLTPLLARPHYQADGGIAHYEIAAGASRLRAATRLGWPSLLTVVRPMEDREFLEALVTENLQRTDPHPLDEAEAYARLEGLGYTVRDIAERVGMPPRYVARRLRLTALIPAARKAFLEGTLFVGHAEALARCTPAQQEKAVTMASDWRGPLPVRTLEERIAEAFHLPLAKAPFTMEDGELVPSAREACRLLGLPEPAQDDDGPPALPSLAHRPDFWTVTLTLPEIENGYVGADTPLLDRLCQRFAVDIAGIRAEREAVYRAAQAEKQAKSAKKAKPLAGDVRRAKAARS